MSRATHLAFEPAEDNDPTLAVDDLADFLTARTGPEDPMLSVTGLEDFFSARQTDDLEAFVRKLEVVVTEALLPHAAVSDAGAPGGPGDPGDVVALVDPEDVGDREENDEFRSEIRRAAVEFQHFAETFHAFASECQHRRTN